MLTGKIVHLKEIYNFDFDYFLIKRTFNREIWNEFMGIATFLSIFQKMEKNSES